MIPNQDSKKNKTKTKNQYVDVSSFLTAVEGNMRGHTSGRLRKTEGDSDVSRLEKGTTFKHKGENRSCKCDYIYKLINLCV